MSRSSPPVSRLARVAAAAAWSGAFGLAALAGAADPAFAQAAPGKGGIYSCVDEQGRRLTSDRPIPECISREQRVHREDGSVRRVVPPSLTAEERAAREAEERRAAQEATARFEAVRRDRTLMDRYPGPVSHDAARMRALEQTRRAIAASQARLGALARERKPLLDEAEFYAGRPLPTALLQKIEANEVAIRSQQEAVQTQLAELDRVNALFDAELAHLKQLWAGAPPGSLAAPPPAAAAQSGRPPATPRPSAGSR